ncbi:MAG: hypothetical protein ACYDBW_06660 [Sulfuricaulis sp.]
MVSPKTYRILVILGTLAVVAVATTFAYYPGLHGPFVFDDYVNFVNTKAISIHSLDFTSLFNAALSNESGILRRPLPALSFALNYYFSNGFTNTFQFKVTNLVIHLINAGLVYWLASLLLEIHDAATAVPRGKRHFWLPGLIAVIWAIHPLQLTSVLYVVQRMTSLSALFVLAGLIAFIYGRRLLQNRDLRGIRLMWGGLLGGTLLGMICKENAALLPLYALVIEFVFFHGDGPGRSRTILTRLYVIPMVLLGLLGLFWLLRYPNMILNTYNLREFTLGERLLTEPRVLWFYISLLLLPTSNRFSLFHDDIAFSTGLFHPWSTVFALTGLILALATGFLSRRKYPLLSFSILWFLAGHVMESSFIGLELVFEHRNYLPSIGPITGLIYGVAVVFNRFRSKAIPVVLSTLTIFVVGFATQTIARAWKSEQSLAQFTVEHHPRSARAHAIIGDLYLQNGINPVQALNQYMIAANLAPYETSYLISMVNISAHTSVHEINAKPSNDSLAHEYEIPHSVAIIRKENGGLHLRLDSRIYDRIARQLQTQPVQARVEGMLTELTDCVLKHTGYCGDLYDADISWNNYALDNPRSNDSLRKALLLNLARLYLDRGDMVHAILIADRSKELDPYHPALAIMRANIYFIANRLNDAEKTILSIERKGLISDKVNQEQADKLLFMIQQARKKEDSKNSR